MSGSGISGNGLKIVSPPEVDGRRTKPLAEKRPSELVFVIGPKLISLDCILPISLELRAENPDLSIRFIFLQRQQIDALSASYVLTAGMNLVGEVYSIAGQRKGLLGKALALMKLLKMMARLARRRSLLFFYSDFEAFPYSFLAWATKLGGGHLVTYAKQAFPLSSTMEHALAKLGGSGAVAPATGDAVLVYHPDQVAHFQGPGAQRVIPVGSPRSMPAWIGFLETTMQRPGLLDIEGRQILPERGPVFAIFYPGDHALPDLRSPTSCRDQFVAVLEAISGLEIGATVVIKPHIICDPDELRQEIAPFDDLEIRVTMGHPQAVGRLADACLFVAGSHVMDDMYVDGTPVIEATLYGRDVESREGSLFPNRGRLEALTRNDIARTLRRVIEKPAALPKAEVEHLFWPKPKSLSALFWPGPA